MLITLKLIKKTVTLRDIFQTILGGRAMEMKLLRVVQGAGQFN